MTVRVTDEPDCTCAIVVADFHLWDGRSEFQGLTESECHHTQHRALQNMKKHNQKEIIIITIVLVIIS